MLTEVNKSTEHTRAIALRLADELFNKGTLLLQRSSEKLCQMDSTTFQPMLQSFKFA